MRQVFKPDRSQEAGIVHFLRHAFAGLFWPPGLGKTAVALFAFHLLRERRMARRMLVISKVKVVSNVWPREIAKWDFCEGMTWALARGDTAEARMEAIRSGAHVVLLNMENTQWLVDLVEGRRVKVKGRWKTLPPERPDLLDGIDVLCIDESSKFRNHASKRFEAIERVLTRFRRRYILTGSPAPRSLMNLWAQMFIVDRGESLGNYITHFRTKYFDPVGPKRWNEWIIKEGSDRKIYKAIAKRILRVGDRALRLPTLPPPVNRMVTLEPAARKLYREMEREQVIELQGQVITAANGGTKTSKLRQIANGRVYPNPPEDGQRQRRGARESVLVHEEKALAVLDIVEETQGTPALIGYEHHSDLESLLAVLGEDSPTLTGGMSDAEADHVIERWNAGQLPYLLAQYEVTAHGLNMQGVLASVVYYGIPWDLETYEQFYRRVYRRGVKGSVMRYHILVEDSVDDLVCLPAIMAKDRRQQRLLDELEKFMERRKKFLGPGSSQQAEGGTEMATSKAAKKASAKKASAKKAPAKRGSAKKTAPAARRRTRVNKGKPAKATLTRPVDKDSKRGKVLAKFLGKDARSPEKAASELKTNRGNVLSHLNDLNRYHGIGYELDGDSPVKITVPGGKSPWA